MPKSFLALVLSGALALNLLTSTEAAQAAEEPPSAPSVTVTDANPQAFPQLELYVAVQDGTGQPLTGLSASNFYVSEDGRSVSDFNIQPLEVGVQAVFALDSNAAFKSRNINGISRLDDIKTSLSTFLQTQTKIGDDLTLLLPDTEAAEHLSQPLDVARALEAYTSSFAGAPDAPAFLGRAIELAAESTPQDGMPRVLVYFSNGLKKPVDELAARAQGAGVRIYTVYVGPQGSENTAGAQNLQALSASTGGAHFALSGDLGLTTLFNLLTNTRYHYRLDYRSAISTTNQHTLVVEVVPANVQSKIAADFSSLAASPAEAAPNSGTGQYALRLRVEPPQVKVSVPNSLTTIPESGLTFNLEMQFPDGHQRALQLAELLVNGNVVASRTAEPFGALDWQMVAPEREETYTIQVRVTDELGLSAETDPATLQVMGVASAIVPDNGLPAALFGSVPLEQVGFGLLGVLVLVFAGGLSFTAWQFGFRRGQKSAERVSPLSASATTGRTRPVVRRIPRTVSSSGGETVPGVPLASDPRLLNAHQTASPAPQPMIGAEGLVTGQTQPQKPVDRTEVPRNRPALPQMPHISLPQLRQGLRHKPAKTRSEAYFEVLEAGGGGVERESIDIVSESLKLGRDAELSDVVFDDRSVSRLHARLIEAMPGVYHLYDEGSTSGTWVNMEKINGTGKPLHPGDVIHLGQVQLRFQVRETPPSAGQLTDNG